MDSKPASTLQKPRSKRTAVHKGKGTWVPELRNPDSNKMIRPSSHISVTNTAQAHDSPLYFKHSTGDLSNSPDSRMGTQLSEEEQVIGPFFADKVRRIQMELASVRAANGPSVEPSSKLLSTPTPLSLSKVAMQNRLKNAGVVPKDASRVKPYAPEPVSPNQVKNTGVVPKDAALKVKPHAPETVIPSNVLGEKPYIPKFAPEEKPVPYQSFGFSEEFIKGSDEWILDFMADPSYKC